MNKISDCLFVVIGLIVFSGCSINLQKQTTVNSIIHDLSDAIERISSKYPELSEFSKNKLIGEMSLYYSYNFKSPKSKRVILPSDFGEKGIYISFSCKPIPSSKENTYAMSPPTLTLPKLKIYLWTEVKAAPDVTSGLVEEIRTLLNLHAEKLKKIDKKSLTSQSSEL